MTLPLIFPPSSLPLFLAAGHGVQLGDNFAAVPRGRGHGRKRRTSTGKPRTVSIAWQLTYSQMVDLDFWLEKSLSVATEEFTAEVPNMGPGRLFWRAKWQEWPRIVPQPTPRGIEWTVTGRLQLFGDGEAARPTTGALAGEVLIPRLGSALLVLPDTPLAGEVTIARIAVTLLAGEVVVGRTSGLVPLSGEVSIPRLGSGALTASSGSTAGGTLTVGELGGSALYDADTILFPESTLTVDSDGTATFTLETAFFFQSSPPANAKVGWRWVDSDTGVLYTYIDDGSSEQWVEF